MSSEIKNENDSCLKCDYSVIVTPARIDCKKNGECVISEKFKKKATSGDIKWLGE